MGHPNVIHWDDVEPVTIDRGDLRGTRWRLAAAAGSRRVGLSRYRLGPGEHAMPVHVHADEEEIVFVLAGRGLSWQDGRTYAVGPGDSIVHRAGGEAHTIVAAADAELELLAFGSGSDTSITWLPRAQAWWLGSHWLPHEGRNPFALEAQAGPLEVPAPEAQRPATIVALGEVPADERVHEGRLRVVRRDIGDVAGSDRCGVGHLVVPAGRQGYPLHCHSAEEELFVVLDGEGVVRLGDDRFPVRRGSVVARPPGTRVGHTFEGGAADLEILAFGTRDPNDIAYYPDSGKVSLRGVGVMFRPEKVGYWEGEP